MALTLTTEAEVLLAIGQNGSAAQISGANILLWGNWAEGDMSAIMDNDLVANYASIGTNWQPYFSQVAANRTAFYAVNQDQNNWELATTQSKLNVFNDSWQEFKKRSEKSDFGATAGL